MSTSRKAKPTPADIRAAERLKARWTLDARRLGITQEVAAAELDITQGAVSQYLNGKIPMNYRTLLGFCRLLGIDDPTEIRDDLPEQQLVRPELSADWMDVVGFRQSVGAGAGTEFQEYAETHSLKFRANSLRRKGLLNRRLAVYYAKGDSMEPRIRTGDAILFDQDDTTPVHDGIFVVRWRGEEFVKRAKIADDVVMFESDNPAGDHVWGRPKLKDNRRDPIEIIGRVRWIGSWEG